MTRSSKLQGAMVALNHRRVWLSCVLSLCWTRPPHPVCSVEVRGERRVRSWPSSTKNQYHPYLLRKLEPITEKQQKTTIFSVVRPPLVAPSEVGVPVGSNAAFGAIAGRGTGYGIGERSIDRGAFDWYGLRGDRRKS